MSFVFSSFFIGVVASTATAITVSNQLNQRKHFLEDKFDNDEFNAYVYQQTLRAKVQEKKYSEETPAVKELRTFINQNIIPPIQQGVNAIFTSDFKKKIDEAIDSIKGEQK